MDELSHAVDEDLLKEIECPVCIEYMVPPIKLCTNGHNICKKYRESVECCPTCRAKFTETRCVALDNIARRLKDPCVNRQSGCLDLLSMEHIAKHHAACLYGKIKCPFQLFKMCSWKGFKNDLKEHAKAAHPANYFEVSTFTPPCLSAAMGILSCFGELFAYYKQQKYGRLYCAVQLIGTSSEASKYKCEFTLRAANGIEQISKTFLVQGYSEDFETVFKSGKYLNIAEGTIRNVVTENKLNLTVTLSRT